MCKETMLLLGGAIPSFEMFLAQWKRLSLAPSHPQLSPFISLGLEWAKRYYNRFDRSKAYLFAMCTYPYVYDIH